MIAVKSLDSALALLNELQDGTGGAVAAYEYMPKKDIFKVIWSYLLFLKSHLKRL